MFFKNIFLNRAIVLICLSGIMFFACYNASAVAEKSYNIGLIDIEKVKTDWPKYKNYAQQVTYEGFLYGVLLEKASSNLTDVESAEIEYQISEILKHSELILLDVLTGEMGDAAEKVAEEKNLHLIFYKHRVTFGGTDITEDIMKHLNE